MSARRRRRRRGADNRGSGGGRNRKQQRSRGDGGGPQRRDTVGFWGDEDELPDARSDVRITEDAAVLPRSLGEPPLPGHERIAAHYFDAVYDRAVQTAGALAAAGGLIEADELAEGRDDE